MAQLLAEFRLSVQESRSPAGVLGRLNERLVAYSRRGTFCTICFVTIDLASGSWIGANAGSLVLAGSMAVWLDAGCPTR